MKHGGYWSGGTGGTGAAGLESLGKAEWGERNASNSPIFRAMGLFPRHTVLFMELLKDSYLLQTKNFTRLENKPF